jgi:hypothetical protein
VVQHLDPAAQVGFCLGRLGWQFNRQRIHWPEDKPLPGAESTSTYDIIIDRHPSLQRGQHGRTWALPHKSALDQFLR